MAGDIKEKLGTSNQSVTITLASLANNAARQSTEIDNSTNLFLDALFQLKVKSGASGVVATGVVNIYVASSADGGTSRTENAGASDAAITLTVPTNAILIGSINVVANAVTYIGSPMSIARAFGGVLPERWVIIVENKSGGALDAVEGSHAKFYQGILNQYT